MAYPTSYPAYGGAPAYPPPPRRKRGLKRIILGILGLLANALGLILSPAIGLFVGAMIAVMGGMALTPLQNGASFDLPAAKIAFISVATEDAGSAQCTVTSTDPEATIDSDTAELESDHDGTSYTQVAQVQVKQDASITVDCSGTEKIAYGTADVGPMLIAGGVGLVIPIVLGFLALILLIWGIIARVRS